MKTVAALAVTALAIGALSLAPATAQERMGGKLGTLELGYWSCATPGIADGAVRFERAALDFETIRGSRYRVGENIGTYLRLGDDVTMTSGPFKGRSFRVAGTNRIREVEDGAFTPVRCIRRPATP